jgi:hypothetical protein
MMYQKMIIKEIDKVQVFEKFSDDLSALHNIIGEGGLNSRHPSLGEVNDYLNSLI